MKILATSDLHFRRDWYAWLLKQASRYDAVFIAGDLLDMSEDLQPQIEFLRGWVARMKVIGTPLFLCDGNHDYNFSAHPWPPSPQENVDPAQAAFFQRARLAEHWMDALLEEGAWIVGGMTKTFPDLGNLIVTSLLYDPQNVEVNATLMEEGASLRRTSPRSPWIVLHHEPPIGLLGSPEQGSRILGDWIEEYQPKIVFSGHDHKSPARNGTCCERIGLSHVFNPGHNPENPFPCHVEIETASMKSRWAC